MPHIIIEYSANLEPQLDIPGFMAAMHAAGLATGLFELGGIRVRALRRDQFIVADGDPANAYVHVTARIGHGRPLEKRKALGEALFNAASTYLEPVFATRPLALQLEIQEIDPDLNYKRNNIHARLAARAKKETAA